MGGLDFVLLGVIALIVGSAAFYIIKAKRSGKRCIGCPDSGACHTQRSEGSCGGSCSGCGGACHREEQTDKTTR